MRIDLDGARRAREEARGEVPVVVFGGREFVLPVELDFEIAELHDAGDTRGFVDALLGKDEAKVFWKTRPTVADISELTARILLGYSGLDPGGIRGLAEFVRRRFEVLEAAFQRDYALDLRRILWGPDRVGVRRFIALARAIPEFALLLEEQVSRTPSAAPTPAPPGAPTPAPPGGSVGASLARVMGDRVTYVPRNGR